MATKIHIQKPLLEAVDRKDPSPQDESRLSKELAPGSDWSPGFFERLSVIDSGTVAAVDEMLTSVRRHEVEASKIS